MKEFDWLRRAATCSRHFFLEASAGTGKTFAIENIVRRLLAHETQPNTVKEILLVTFTRAATRDMKQRILQNLEGQNPPLHHAIAHFDEAQIFTIHGFCHAMLQEYAMEAGVVVDSADPDDHSYLPLVEETIVDYFRKEFKEPAFHPLQLECLLKKAKGSFSLLVKKVRNLVLGHQPLPCGRSWDELSLLLPKELPNNLYDAFLAIAPLFKGLCNVQRVPHERFIQQVEWLQTNNPAILLEEELFVEYLHPSYLKKNAEMPENPFASIRAVLIELWKEASSEEAILGRIVTTCRERVQEKIDEFELTPPDYLLQKMAKAIQNPQFASLIRNKYSVAIIDEFQDTDPIQWEIFRTLFYKEDKTLYLVGDPKQSIYSFRGADLGVYLEAKSDLGTEHCFSLKTNYRSEPSLVEALNRLFSEGENWLDSIEYQAVKHNPDAQDSAVSDQKRHVHFLLHESQSRRSVPSVDDEENVLFPYITREIQTLSLPYSNIAVLIKDKFQATRLQQFLQRKGIASQTKGATHIADTRMFWVMERFLLVLFDATDVSTMKQLLASPLARYSHWELRKDLSEEIAQFKECATIMEEVGFAAAFSAIMDATFKGKTPEESLVDGQNLVDYSDLMQIAELLIERATGRKSSIEDLIDYLYEVKNQEIEEAPLLKRRVLSEGEAVQILTTHMSKGLEYDIVFALGMASRSPHDDHPAEKMRQFYVALTRAKKRVYLPYIHCVKPGNAPIELFLQKMLPSSFSLAELQIKIHDLGLTYEMAQPTEVEKIGSRQVPQLEPRQKPPQIRALEVRSFSSLASHGVEREPITPEEDQLPLGADTGNFMHSLFEKIIDRGIYRAEEKMAAYIGAQVTGTKYEGYFEQIKSMVENAFALDIDGFTLQDVCPEQMITESEFRFNSSPTQMIKGFADLLVFHKGKYYIIDWKTNFLGNHAQDYEVTSLHKEMERNDYFLQGNIYASALKKHLLIIDSNPYEEIFGGAVYIFLRGLFWKECGRFAFMPNGDFPPIEEGVRCSV